MRRRIGGFARRISMRTRLLVRMILSGALAGGLCSQLQSLAAAQGQTTAATDSSGLADAKNTGAAAQVTQTGPKLDEIIDRVIKRAHDEIAAFDLYSPIEETYIQEVKFNQRLGTVRNSNYYFLWQ